MLGERPSLADFAFYGPFYAHLYKVSLGLIILIGVIRVIRVIMVVRV
jgi:hypothetical protein